MGSGVQRTRCGSFYGTAANIDIRTVGFRPRKVELYNVDGLATLIWTESMADAAGVKRVTAGTMSIATAGVTPLSNGFRLGTDGDMNVAAELVHYVAHE